VTFPGTLPASLDNTIKKIGYTYDDFGRKTKVTSYSDTGSTVANEVAFEYGPWGAVTKSMQDHVAAATDTDPNVQYAYEDENLGTPYRLNCSREAVRPRWTAPPATRTPSEIWGHLTDYACPVARAG